MRLEVVYGRCMAVPAGTQSDGCKHHLHRLLEPGLRKLTNLVVHVSTNADMLSGAMADKGGPRVLLFFGDGPKPDDPGRYALDPHGDPPCGTTQQIQDWEFNTETILLWVSCQGQRVFEDLHAKHAGLPNNCREMVYVSGQVDEGPALTFVLAWVNAFFWSSAYDSGHAYGEARRITAAVYPHWRESGCDILRAWRAPPPPPPPRAVLPVLLVIGLAAAHMVSTFLHRTRVLDHGVAIHAVGDHGTPDVARDVRILGGPPRRVTRDDLLAFDLRVTPEVADDLWLVLLEARLQLECGTWSRTAEVSRLRTVLHRGDPLELPLAAVWPTDDVTEGDCTLGWELQTAWGWFARLGGTAVPTSLSHAPVSLR